MTETARALLATIVLAATGLGVFAWRLGRLDSAEPGRLIGELRFSQWMAVVLGCTGGLWLGITAAHDPPGFGALETTLAVATVVFATWTLHRETRQSLLLLCGAFLAHALLDIAHRPGGLAPDLAERWLVVGCAASNVYFAALCFWVQRR